MPYLYVFQQLSCIARWFSVWILSIIRFEKLVEHFLTTLTSSYRILLIAVSAKPVLFFPERDFCRPHTAFLLKYSRITTFIIRSWLFQAGLNDPGRSAVGKLQTVPYSVLHIAATALCFSALQSGLTGDDLIATVALAFPEVFPVGFAAFPGIFDHSKPSELLANIILQRRIGQAPAGTNLPTYQSSGRYFFFIAAVTLASPYYASLILTLIGGFYHR